MNSYTQPLVYSTETYITQFSSEDTCIIKERIWYTRAGYLLNDASNFIEQATVLCDLEVFLVVVNKYNTNCNVHSNADTLLNIASKVSTETNSKPTTHQIPRPATRHMVTLIRYIRSYITLHEQRGQINCPCVTTTQEKYVNVKVVCIYSS
jgi:hypothetical protein